MEGTTPRWLWALTHSSHSACYLWCFFPAQRWLWNISVENSSIARSRHQVKERKRFAVVLFFFFFFFLHVLNFSCQPLISFCQFLPRWQNKSGNTLHFLLRASRARRLPSAPALAHAGSLVNSDRFCWVCDCCSVPVVQAWSGLRSASWLLFKWYFLNVSLFVYKHYFLTYATS